jgi:chemotaxis protein MotB
MKKLWYFSLVLLLAGCVSQGTFDLKANEASLLAQNLDLANNRIAALETQKQQAESDISDLNTRLIAQLKTNSDLQQTLMNERADLDRTQQTFSSRKEQMQEQLEDLNQNNQQLLASIEQLQQERASLQQEQDQLKKQVEAERVAREEKVANLKNTYDQLVGALEQEIKRGELTITNLKGQLSVNLPNKILFDSGQTQVNAAGKKVLHSLGDIMNKFPDKALLVEGHTDNVKISSRLKETYPTNWELSTARANSVVHVLQDEVGLPGERLIAAGYSEFRPVADNGTDDGKAANRRIQIQLVPMPGSE